MDCPFYLPESDEIEIFERSHQLKLPVLLKGPTGAGKTRFVEKMSYEARRPLVVINCNEDTSATDLLGRYLVKGAETVWVDGPVTRAVREGLFLYLDEIAEAREDVVVLLHSLSDHRRELYIDKTNEVLTAPPEFQLIASFNPGYQNLKELKPSTRQRFVTIQFQFPSEEKEIEILKKESGISKDLSKKWVQLANKIRSTPDLNLKETISTRLLVYASKLVQEGLHPRVAGRVSIVNVLTDDEECAKALQHMLHLTF